MLMPQTPPAIIQPAMGMTDLSETTNVPTSPALLTLLRLTPDEAQRLWQRATAARPALAALAPYPTQTPPTDLPKALLLAAVTSNTDHASLVLTLSRDQDTVSTNIMETMIGHPITRPAPRATSTAKLKNPPRTTKTRPLKYDPSHTIRILVPTNPKRPGSEPHRRFDLYIQGQTAEEAVALGVLPADIVWDRDHNFIALDAPC